MQDGKQNGAEAQTEHTGKTGMLQQTQKRSRSFPTDLTAWPDL